MQACSLSEGPPVAQDCTSVILLLFKLGINRDVAELRAGSAMGLQQPQRLLHNTNMRLALRSSHMLRPHPMRHKSARAHTAALLRAIRGTGVLRSTPPHTWKM